MTIYVIRKMRYFLEYRIQFFLHLSDCCQIILSEVKLIVFPYADA